jgi:hypothetical protein
MYTLLHNLIYFTNMYLYCNCIVVLYTGCCIALDRTEIQCIPFVCNVKKISPSEINIFIYVIICTEYISVIPSGDIHNGGSFVYIKVIQLSRICSTVSNLCCVWVCSCLLADQ